MFTGFHDLLDLELLLQLSRSSAQVFYIGDENAEKAVYELIDSALYPENRKSELHACVENTARLGGANGYDLLKRKRISVFFADDVSLFPNIYDTGAEAENRRMQETILSIVDSYDVSSINYISSIYANSGTDCENANFNVYFSRKQANERFVAALSEKKRICAKIYRTPFAFRLSGDDVERDFYNEMYVRIGNFVDWVNGRIPSYFPENRLTVFAGHDCVWNILTVKDAAESIVRIYGSDYGGLRRTFDIIGPGYLSVSNVIKKISGENFGIETRLSTDMGDLNMVDMIFDSNYLFYYPKVLEKTDCDFWINVGGLDGGKRNGHADPRRGAKAARRPAAVEKTEKTVVLDDGKQLTYYTAGTGEALLIVNAYGVDAEAWDDLVSLLSKEHRVIYWKMRGLFNEQKPDNEPGYTFNVSRQVLDIEAVASYERLSEFHLMSWCSGAKVAVFYHATHPEQIKSLIFVAGEFAPYLGSEGHISKFRQNIQLIAGIVKEDKKMLDFYIKIIHNGMFNRPAKSSANVGQYIYEIVPEKYRNILLSPFASKETMVNFLNMCIEYYIYDVTDLLKNIKCPTLFISAEHDQVAPCKQSEWAHGKVSGSHSICFPCATHLLILEKTRDVNEIIRQHFKYNQFA